MSGAIWEGPSIEWDPALTLPDLADRNARNRPDDVVLVDATGERTMTNAELASAFRRVARGLAAAGFARGDCLCALMPNDLAWYVAALAAQSLGGTISGINPLATPDEIVRQFSHVPAKAILTVPQFGEVVDEIAGRCSVSILLSAASSQPGMPSLWELDGAEAPQARRCFAEDPAMFPFSSGTSGLPKPVVITQRNLVCGGHQMSLAVSFGRGDRFLGLAPLFHVIGPSLFACALVAGGAVVVVPRFEPELVFDAAERHRATHLPLLSPVVRLLAHHPAGRDRNYSVLKTIVASGAPLAERDQVEAAERSGCPVVQVYGMTETVSGICADDIASPTPGTVGRPVPLTAVRVVDARTGRNLGAGETGEIEVRAPNVMQGYLACPADTAKIMTPDGWLRTGDIGEMGDDGKLRITGRSKELIKVNSGQVPPAELEAVLSGHSAVADAAVIGRPNRYAGEVPVAFVVLRVPADPFEIMDWVNGQVIHYKRIRAIEIVDLVPRNALGKIDRKALAAMDRDRRDGTAELAA